MFEKKRWFLRLYLLGLVLSAAFLGAMSLVTPKVEQYLKSFVDPVPFVLQISIGAYRTLMEFWNVTLLVVLAPLPFVWFSLPRFSLRTLVIFVLLVGSGATLWWNWEPWARDTVIRAGRHESKSAFSRDWKLLASFAESWLDAKGNRSDSELHVSNTCDGRQIAAWRFPAGYTESIEFSPRGDRLALALDCGKDITTFIVDVGDVSKRVVLDPPLPGHLGPRVYWTHDGKFVYSVDELQDGVRVWSAETGETAYVLRKPGGTPNDGYYTTKEYAATLKRLTQAANLSELAAVLKQHDEPRVNMYYKPYIGVDACCSPAGIIVTSFPGIPKLQAWSMATGKQISSWDIDSRICRVDQMSLAPNGETVAILPNRSDGVESRVLFVNLDSGKINSIDYLGRLPSNIVYSRDSRLVAMYQTIWDLQTGKRIQTFDNYPLRLFPDFSRALLPTTDNRGTCFADVRTKRVLWSLPHTESGGPFVDAISPDGDRFASYASGRTWIYSRRRPEDWWGVAWLPEFWLTLLFAGALVWSVWRERRTKSVAG